MIIKSLISLSIICNLIGFNLSAKNLDQKLSINYSRENSGIVEASEREIALPTMSALPSVKTGAAKANILSKQYALVDGETGTLLNSKNSDSQVPIASTTKIMTAIVALENYSLDELVTVPYEATTQTPTVVFLRTNEKITVSELLHCLLIKSGNDSAYALASHMDKTDFSNTELFINKMNQKADELGMTDTHYMDSAGLSDEGYSTANDLATITRYALQNPTFREIVSTPKYVATNIEKTIYHSLENSNRLITTYQYSGAIGVKTGFTYEASHCLVGAATRGGHTLIAVILGTYADTATASADEARKLLDWGFANVSWSN